MPVGSGSIKRASRKAAELEEKKATTAEEAAEVSAEAPVEKPVKKTTARKTPAKKAPAKRTTKKAAAEADAPAVEAPAAAEEKTPAQPEVFRNLHNGEPIANEAAQLGKNERIEVLQNMPVYLL